MAELKPHMFRVLVVAEEVYARKALVEYAHQAGYRASGAGDIQKVAAALKEDVAHLVVVDLDSRQLKGPDIIRAIRKSRPKTKFVGLVDELPSVETQAGTKVDAYLQRPLSQELVAGTLGDLLLVKVAGPKHRIVIIDDDADSCTAAEHSLVTRGFDAAAFQDPGEGLEFVRKYVPDLVLLDLNMPNTSGFEIASQIRSNIRTRRVPILIFTSDPSRANVLKSAEIGVNGFVSKPFDPRILTQKVREVLASVDPVE